MLTIQFRSCILAGVLLVVGSEFLAATGPANLLVIQTDEHNFRTLGCYREHLPADQAFIWGERAIVDTPNLDSIAHRGAICTSFYATSPVCTPSRAALLSGRYPQNTGAVTNDLPLRDEIVTFAARLQRMGYATGFAGKWHLDGPGKPQWQPARQFGFADNRFMFNRGHWKMLELTPNGPRVKGRDRQGRESYDANGADETSFTTDWLTDRTIEFIEENQQQPFCYMVSIPDPHGPNAVREPYDTMFDPRLFHQPRTFDQTKDQTPAYLGPNSKSFSPLGMARYFGMVKCIDDNVGRILDKLKELNLLENTTIVFTSDHGDLCGEHHRDNKGNPYEASARVPFMIASPGKIQPGTVLNQAMSGIDFTPTILNILHPDVEHSLADVEGRDLSALFTTGRADDDFQDVIFLRRAGTEAGWVAAVTDRYKLVLSPQDTPWLFDMQLDPDELVNYFESPSHKTTRQYLAAALAKYGPAHQDGHVRHPKVLEDLVRAQAVE
ncbi:MAG: sulfatase [Planctomycetales bacterium]|nr:sulfatase [Planctomycetales bacterium]